MCNAAPLERIRVCETHCVLNLMLDKEDVYYPLGETPTKVTLLIDYAYTITTPSYIEPSRSII